MAYQDIPLATDRFPQSQKDIRANFDAINGQFTVNHTALTAATDLGYHKKVSVSNVAGDPALGTDEGAYPRAQIYTKHQGAAGSQTTELFYSSANEPGTAQIIRQLTNLSITNLGNGGTAGGTLYRIDLPVNVTIYLGRTLAVTGSKTVTFPVAFTTIYSAIATVDDPNVNIVNCQTAVGGLTLITSNSVIRNWVAIGRI